MNTERVEVGEHVMMFIELPDSDCGLCSLIRRLFLSAQSMHCMSAPSTASVFYYPDSLLNL